MVHSDGKALNLKQKQIANRLILELFAPARARLTRKAASGRADRVNEPDRIELLWKGCGAFRDFRQIRSLLQRDTIQKARDVALDDVARLATLAALSGR
jgi:hypothetical protein